MNLLAPQAALVAGVLGALGLGLVRRPPAIGARALALAAPIAALWLLRSTMPGVLGPLVGIDLKGLCWQLVIFAGALPLAFLSSGDDVEAALFLGSVLGMSLLAVAGNLIMLFVGLEFMSLPAYLLVARAGEGDSRLRLEAAVKYFFAGALGGALFLLGLALYYADTRSFGPTLGPLGLQGQAGAALMAAGALFKIGAVPLHWWLPDVYSAAAPEVAGFLATSMKAAAVLFLMRVVSLAPDAVFVRALPGVGALTALVGAFFALRQQRLQRLLAYLSLSHAGLLVIGVGAWALLGHAQAASASLLFYLGADALMSNGSFAFLKASGAVTRADLRGYAAAAPGLAGAFAVLLFALAGIPPTGGFVAELLIFWQAVHAQLAVPIVLGAVAALVSLGYCLSLLRDLYFEEAGVVLPPPAGCQASAARIVVLVCAIGIMALVLAPLFLRGLAGSVWR